MASLGIDDDDDDDDIHLNAIVIISIDSFKQRWSNTDRVVPSIILCILALGCFINSSIISTFSLFKANDNNNSSKIMIILIAMIIAT